MLPPQSPMFGPYEFVVRRAHSLTGLIPVGGYMIIHLATNASILDGPKTFQARVDQIHSVGPSTLFVLEWAFIFLPILFHGLIGFAIVLRGKRNLASYSFSGNFRYTLQRLTGVVALVFILYHVFQMHGWIRFEWWSRYIAQPLGGARFDALHAAASAGAVLSGSLLVQLIYIIGVLACVYHLANGLWTMGITWGVWTTPHSQRWANYPCAAFGILLALVGLAAIFAMARYPQGLLEKRALARQGAAGPVLADRTMPLVSPIGPRISEE